MSFLRADVPPQHRAQLGLAAALLVLSASCAPAPAAQAPPLPVVTFELPEHRSIVDWSEVSGRVEAAEVVEVRPRVSGYLLGVHFEAGKLVAKGDVLFTIDPRWNDAAHQRAQADLTRAKTRLALAEREAERYQGLSSSKAVTAQEVQGRADDLLVARAELEAAQALERSAQLDLEHAEVRAPIAGRISRALATEGNYVSGTPGAATLLATVVSVDPMYVYADVDEGTYLRFAGLVRDGSIAAGEVEVDMRLVDEHGFPRHGKIESFDNRLDPGTGSIVLRAEFPNPAGDLVPGLFARLRLPGSAAYDALLVDEKAILTDQSQRFVWVIGDGGTPEYRQVRLGTAIDGKRIVKSGLESGDRVVVNGTQFVRPGSAVDAKPKAGVRPAEPAVR